MLLGAAAGVGALLLPRRASASPEVPAALQADLVDKAARYDRRLPSRLQDGVARLLTVFNGDRNDSRAVGLLFHNRIRELGQLGGHPVEAVTAAFDTVEGLVERCRAEGQAVVYLSSGLGRHVASLAAALDGVSVLTVGADPRYAVDGAVLSFSLVGGRPKLLVHLSQAKRQDVDFRADLLRLAEIVG